MYWKYDGNRIVTPTIPFYAIGDDEDFTLTLYTEAGEELVGGYLCVADTDYVGILWAKAAEDSTYQSVGGLFNPSCILPGMAESSSQDIDFRLNLPDGSAQGPHAVPLVILYGDEARLGATGGQWLDDWTPALWHDSWVSPELWRDSW